jgi:hypothetical protein
MTLFWTLTLAKIKATEDSLQQLDEDNIIDFNDSSFSFVLKSNRGLLNPLSVLN